MQPLTYELTRLHLRGAMHRQGQGIVAVNREIAGASDNLIDEVSKTVPGGYEALATIGTSPGAQAVGAGGQILGEIITALQTFFASPLGKQVEAALVQALIAFIAGA